MLVDHPTGIAADPRVKPLGFASLEELSIDEVGTLLRCLNLGRYASSFAAVPLNGADLALARRRARADMRRGHVFALDASF